MLVSIVVPGKGLRLVLFLYGAGCMRVGLVGRVRGGVRCVRYELIGAMRRLKEIETQGVYSTISRTIYQNIGKTSN